MTVGLLPELEVDTLPRRAGTAELDFDDYNDNERFLWALAQS